MDFKSYINRWMNEHKDEYIADLTELVAINSVRGEAEEGAPFGKGPAKALAKALEICGKYRFITKNYDNYVGTADLCDKKTALDILAHLDIVGEGTGWDTDPFTAVVKDDGCIYGRGTSDDKGPALAALFAMRAVKESGLELKNNVRLIMGTDEESGSGDLAYYFTIEKSAPSTFSPDCGFPVFNTEKGGYKPVFTKEFSDGDVLPRVTALRGGFRINVIPSNAEAEILGMNTDEVMNVCEDVAREYGVEISCSEITGGTKIFVKGHGAHASTPELGNNGLTAIIGIVAGLPLADCPSTTAVRELSKVFPHGDGEGKAMGIAQKDEVSGALTVALTLFDMENGEISGQFDGRVPICANDENCRKVFEKLMTGLGYDVFGTMDPAHHTPADSPFIKTLIKSYEMYTGLKGECCSMGGGTYVHNIEGGVAFGPEIPGFDGCIHGPNERANIADMMTAAKIYAQVIADMCC